MKKEFVEGQFCIFISAAVSEFVSPSCIVVCPGQMPRISCVIESLFQSGLIVTASCPKPGQGEVILSPGQEKTGKLEPYRELVL